MMELGQGKKMTESGKIVEDEVPPGEDLIIGDYVNR